MTIAFIGRSGVIVYYPMKSLNSIPPGTYPTELELDLPPATIKNSFF